MDVSPELFVTLPAGRRKVRICYQTLGNPSDPAVLLINGHGGSMLEWRDQMLALFSPASQPHYIIRYDHRDTGLSTEFPVPGEYTLSDMAGDAEGLIDHLGISSKGFHLVGASMGGPMACMIAARRPQQVRSLTLLYTTPGATAGIPLKSGVELPGAVAYDRRSAIEQRIELHHALATQPLGKEESEEIKELVVRVTDREIQGGTLYSKGPNHGAAAFAGWPGIETIKIIKCPTTVIQAAKDQFFSEAHGERLASDIQGAEYVLWEDVGHELPKRIWSRLAEVFLRTWQRGDDEWAKDSEETKE